MSTPVPDPRPRPLRARNVALLLLALLCGISFWSRVEWIEGSIPYPRHFDERFVSQPASRILRSGSLDPGFFRYPSLPIYVASIGMRIGARLSSTDPAEIESVGPPYYSPPTVMFVPRVLHAAVAAATLLLVAAIGYRLRPSPAMLVLGPAVLAFNGFYHEEGWRYLNVDMFASFFALAATLQLLRAADHASFRSLVVGPAVLCGATIASKYPSGLIVAPAVLAVLWYAPRERRTRWTLALLAGAATAFVLFCPYSLLDSHTFLADVLHEVRHYATGQARHQADRGLPQMAYYGGYILGLDGPVVLALAGVGLVAAWRADRRRAVLLALFPIGLFVFLALQRTHYHRNLLPGYGMLAVAAGIGIHVVHGWLAPRLGLLRHPRAADWLAGLVLLIGVGASVPRAGLLALVPETDSRNQAAAWLSEKLVPDGVLIVPYFLHFAPGALPDSVAVLHPREDEGPRALPKRRCYVLAPDVATHSMAPGNRMLAARYRAWLGRYSAGEPLAEFGEVRFTRAPVWTGRLRLRIFACRSEP